MPDIDVSSFESLKEEIQELLAPLETAQAEFSARAIEQQDSRDLIMGDLTMIALLLTNVDLRVSPDELDFINGIRRVISADAPQLNSYDYEELCREFLRLYPHKRLTIDHLPSTIEYLLAYDKVHGTNYAEKSRSLFLDFAEATVRADKNADPVESIVLANLRETLYVSTSRE